MSRERTCAHPNDPDGDGAHIYRFQELVAGERLICDERVEMRNLQVVAYTLVATPYSGRDGYTVGPPFELVG